MAWCCESSSESSRELFVVGTRSRTALSERVESREWGAQNTPGQPWLFVETFDKRGRTSAASEQVVVCPLLRAGLSSFYIEGQGAGRLKPPPFSLPPASRPGQKQKHRLGLVCHEMFSTLSPTPTPTPLLTSSLLSFGPLGSTCSARACVLCREVAASSPSAALACARTPRRALSFPPFGRGSRARAPDFHAPPASNTTPFFGGGGVVLVAQT